MYPERNGVYWWALFNMVLHSPVLQERKYFDPLSYSKDLIILHCSETEGVQFGGKGAGAQSVSRSPHA